MKLRSSLSSGSAFPLSKGGSSSSSSSSSSRQQKRNGPRRTTALAGTSTIVLPVVSELVRRSMMTATGTVAANNVATGQSLCPLHALALRCHQLHAKGHLGQPPSIARGVLAFACRSGPSLIMSACCMK